jgi:hypothetical protein
MISFSVPKLRFQPPDRLPGAADFSKDDGLRGSLNTVKLLRSQPWVWDDLREACNLEKNYARKREPGYWELAAVAFVSSKHVDIQPWWDETTEDLWHECGFKTKPPYMRVYRRLRELETVCEHFLTAVGTVVRRCREHDPRVMAHVHFDFTEDETHAGLTHDCQAGEQCGYQKRTGRRVPRMALRPERAKTYVAREHRHELSDEDPATSVAKQKAASPEKSYIVTRGAQKLRRVRINGCWYRTRDLNSGFRAYTGPRGGAKVWHGYYAGKAIDHFTGGVIPSVDSAKRQEWDIFPELYDSVCDALGEAPETAIADRGVSIAACFEHVTKNGTAPVFPWRRAGGGDRKRHDKDTHDRHGVMRCKHCGGPMKQIRFSATNAKPRLWFRCMFPNTADCAKDQTISCAADWRLLVPLARTEPLYHELKKSHSSYEGVHDYWRDRYKVAADDLGVRPKVVSRDWHRLRANVASLIDWLRIASKNGWLSSVVAAVRHIGERKFMKMGKNAASDLGKKRMRMGLAQPYGAAAKKLGLGKATPPSRRVRNLAPNAPGP